MVSSLRKLSLLLATLGVLASNLDAQTIPPGRIRNPDANGLQLFMSAAYNSAQDYYLITTRAGFVLGLKLSPAGTLMGGDLVLSGIANVQGSWVAYNPDRNEFLLVWRLDSPQTIFGRYLDGDANPIGDPFVLGSGVGPRVAYSTVSHRYIVVWSTLGTGVFYAMVNGDSTGSPIVQGASLLEAGAFSGRVAYGSAQDNFLVVFTRDFSPPTRADVRGKLVSGAGGILTGTFGIGGGLENQQIPDVGYSPEGDRYLVHYEDWSTGGFPDVNGNFVSGAGSVGPRFSLTPGSPTWDVPGPITYNAATKKLMASWFDGVISGKAREVDPSGPFGSAPSLGSSIQFSNANANPLSMAARPDPSDPQVMIAFRNHLGADGVWASILHLTPAAPQITSNTMPAGGFGVAYSESIPVSGGAPPLSFVLTGGALPLGLSLNPSTGEVSGTPNAIGISNFTVQVTDSFSPPRSDELAMSLEITLAAPTGQSPTGVTNDPTPTFQWTASPTATSYRLIVDQVGGGNVIDQAGITTNSFTAGTALVSGNTYRWQVQATDGSNFSPFSTPVVFEVDSLAPPVVLDLTGSVPLEAPIAGVTAEDASGIVPGLGPENAVDGNLDNFFTTPGRTTEEVEYITLDLGSEQTVGRVRIRSAEGFGDLMPRNFEIQLSNQPNTGFTTVHTVTAFSAPVSPSQWFTFNFAAPGSGRYLKLHITGTNQYSGDNLYYVTLSEIEAWTTAPIGSILVTWTAPGDDNTTPTVGRVASYDIRYKKGTGTTIDFALATPVVSPPDPLDAPAMQSLMITGLDPEESYQVALTSTDDAGNVAGVSNTAVVASKGFPPAAIADLAASNPQLTSIDLDWKAPSDPPFGVAADTYDIRVSTSPITSENVDSAVAATVQGGMPSAAAPNTPQSVTIINLQSNTLYYFVIRSIDFAGNVSMISNNASLSTLDSIPPDPVSTLDATFPDDTTVDLVFTITGDDGSVGTATSIDVRYLTTGPVNDGNWSTAIPVSGEPVPEAAGNEQRMLVTGLLPNTTYFFGMTVTDENNNTSAVSNSDSITTLADLPEPTIDSPTPGSVLAGTSVTFQWSPNGVAVDEWWLSIGTAAAETDLFDASMGGSLSGTASGLPIDGSTLYVRLWYRMGAIWGHSDFQYTASVPPPPPGITSPTAGSTLIGESQLFQWTANGAAVTEWWLYAGSSAGASDYFDSGSLGTSLSTTVTGLPTDSSTVHVRLWYQIGGVWQSSDSQYTAAAPGGGGGPQITDPTPSTSLPGAAVTFQWTANGQPVTDWWLYVGTSSADNDLFDSGGLGGSLSILVTGLPTDGRQIFVRLWYRIGADWLFTDFEYTAAIGGGGTPDITSPTSGSTLTGTSQLFQWTANGSAVTAWWLYAGSTQGATDFFDSGNLGAAVSVTATGLPVDGSTIHVRLWYEIGGTWQSSDFQYTAANIQPTITIPTPGSTLSGSSVAFNWIANGLAVTEWWVYAGSTQGGSEFFDSGNLGASLSTTVIGLPTDGSTVHVRLWYLVGSDWLSTDVQYTSGP